jgi:hypothetical protein
MNKRRLGVIAAALYDGAAAAAATSTSAEPPASQPASYVFATELGSGIYDVAGRTLLVYRLPFSYSLRAATEDVPGVNLTLPAAVGFFNYSPVDLVHTQLPSHLDAISFVPGLQLDYKLDEHWHVHPYVRAGGSFASADFDGWLYGLGTTSTYAWQTRGLEARVLNDVLFAGVIYKSSAAPNDNLLRLRNGLELRRGTGITLAQHEIELSIYGFADYFPDAPRAPVAGTRTSHLQFEPGFMIGALPPWDIHGFQLPRLGVGYRFAGDLSGWHLVISTPF